MTTTDTLKLYAALHAEVPETKPEDMAYDSTAPEALALCRCAALEWACRKVGWVGKLRNELDRWFYDLPHKDSRLIDICRAIHASKGEQSC